MPLSVALLARTFVDSAWYQTITVSTSVVGLAVPTVPAGSPEVGVRANYALITVESNPIRWTINGTNPASGGPGHKAVDGDAIELRGSDALANFKAVRDGAADATIRVTYGRLK